jgi:hypothetical protein
MSRFKKELLDKGKLFVPVIFSFGAVLEDIPLREYVGDATKISNALRTIQGYFQVDGVTCYADRTIMAEALGCGLDWSECPPAIEPLPSAPTDVDTAVGNALRDGRLGTAVEVTQRLNTLLSETILMCSICGPLTLARQLLGSNPRQAFDRRDILNLSTKAILAFSKALGDAGIDLLLLTEEELPALDEPLLKELRRCYSPIWNTAKFYDMFPLLTVRQFMIENVEPLGRIVDGVVLPVEYTLQDSLGATRRSFALPVAILEKESDEIEAYLTKSSIGGNSKAASFFLLTTENEIPKSINKEFMIRGIQTVKEFIKR